jgi:hypothetical protein
MDGARRQAIDRKVLANVRDYLKAHWKQPARVPPMV